MLIKRKILDRIVAGEIDRAFRCWKRPTVKTGGRLRTAVGELAIDDVSEVDPGSLTPDDALKAGYETLAALRSDLAVRSDGKLYRIMVCYDGPDQRRNLREKHELSDRECAELLDQLERIDRGAGRDAWSTTVLDLIARWPQRRAQELADEVGMEKRAFKRHVRKLGDRGLTESMPVGYRLSPRGKRLLQYAQRDHHRNRMT